MQADAAPQSPALTKEERRAAHEARLAAAAQLKAAKLEERRLAHEQKQGAPKQAATGETKSFPAARTAKRQRRLAKLKASPLTSEERRAIHEAKLAAVAEEQSRKEAKRAAGEIVAREREAKARQEKSLHEVLVSTGCVVDVVREALVREASRFGEVSNAKPSSLSDFAIRYVDPASVGRALAGNWGKLQITLPLAVRSQVKDENCVHFSVSPGTNVATKEAKTAVREALTVSLAKFGAIADIRLASDLGMIQFLNAASAKAALSAPAGSLSLNNAPLTLEPGPCRIKQQKRKRGPEPVNGRGGQQKKN